MHRDLSEYRGGPRVPRWSLWTAAVIGGVGVALAVASGFAYKTTHGPADTKLAQPPNYADPEPGDNSDTAGALRATAALEFRVGVGAIGLGITVLGIGGAIESRRRDVLDIPADLSKDMTQM